jgi:hypothetical protein
MSSGTSVHVRYLCETQFSENSLQFKQNVQEVTIPYTITVNKQIDMVIIVQKTAKPQTSEAENVTVQ